jgi:hypothetical protein
MFTDTVSLFANAAELTTKRAKTRCYLGDSTGRNVPLGEGKVLRVQGIPIGKIVAMASTTNPMDVFSLSPSQSASSAPLSHRPTPSYYTSCQVFTALLSCLTLTSQSQHVHFWDHSWGLMKGRLRDNARVLWHICCLLCVPPNTRPSQPNPESSDIENSKIHAKRMFSQWLKTNAVFLIHRKILKGWTRGWTSWLTPVFRVLDSLLAIPFVIVLILINYAPTITMVILLTTRGYYFYSFGLHGKFPSCSFPQLLRK